MEVCWLWGCAGVLLVGEVCEPLGSETVLVFKNDGREGRVEVKLVVGRWESGNEKKGKGFFYYVWVREERVNATWHNEICL